MTGSRASVLGVRWEQALEGFRTQMPVRFETAEEDVWVNAVVVELGPDGLATSIEQVLEPAPEDEAVGLLRSRRASASASRSRTATAGSTARAGRGRHR